MREFSIDLETMGTGPSAAILAIGAVAMDFDTLTQGEPFYATVDLESSVALGGVMDPGTVLWWLKQSDAARAAVTRGGLPIHEALTRFSGYLRREAEDRHPHLWGHGANFDNVILRSAYGRAGIVAPWDYKGDRCFRTVRALHLEVPDVKPALVHHDLEDAKAQAQQLLNILRGGKP